MEQNATSRQPRMAGKVAIVTGAGSQGDGIGNGRAIAILMAREGAKVGLVDAKRDWVDATKRMIDAEGGTSIVIECDVTKPASCKRAVETVVETWGRLDVLVNNVGIAGPQGNAVDVDLEAWEAAMRVNVTSMMLMAKFAVPAMLVNGGGAIVNMSSVAGIQAGNPSLLYPTSKGAVISLTRAMASHHGPSGIRVNAVAPGLVYTPFVSESKGMTPEMRESRKNRSLLRTEGTGWDIGYAVLYLASDEARWVTGQTLNVDAGTTAGHTGVPGIHELEANKVRS
jgi:NAD(P)-dependent dehydrogenase (short-subunit alcohol dehydrogenase family)